MDKITLLRLAQAGGVFTVVIGLLLFGILGTLEVVGLIFRIIGTVMIVFGLVWIWKINKRITRERRRPVKTKIYTILFLTLLTVGIASSSVFYTQQYFSRECLELYQKVRFIEYAIVGFLIIAGFLAFAPILLGRTILGPIFQELQYMAGAMLLLLIFVLLVIFPLDPMFRLDSPTNPTGCYIDINNLVRNGPPLLRVILKLLWIKPEAVPGGP